MFGYLDSREGDVRVDVAFTDSSTDLQGHDPDFPERLARLEAEAGVPFARLTQVHGDDIVHVDAPMPLGQAGTGDALVTATRGLGPMIRVADCVPIVLADADAGVIGAVHSGRPGTALDIATRTVEELATLGATELVAWVGPHVCGACYEMPAALRDEVAALVPETWSTTSWGTPALDLGAGVRAQLRRAGVEVIDVGGCTREDASLHSYRRDGAAAGRFAGLVWMS